MTLTLPTDAMSPFRTEMLDDTWQGWLTAVDPTTYLQRSALTNVEVMADRITMTVNTFPVTGDELIWAVAAYADFTDPVRTFRWFSAEPSEDTVSFLDAPRVTAGDTYDAEIEWSAPATDVTGYQVQFLIGGFRTAISMVALTPYATLPALPSAYDPEVSFPIAGARGDIRVAAGRGASGPMDMMANPFRFDGERALGPRRMITY
jgi:hypothetical protein